MPNYIPYSPWADAANFGQGLAQGLGALALQIPQFRARQQQDLAQRDYLRAQAESEYALTPERVALLKAQTATQGAQGRYYGARADESTANLEALRNLQAGAEEISGAIATNQPIPVQSVRKFARGVQSSSDSDLSGIMNFITQAFTTSGSGVVTNPDVAREKFLGGRGREVLRPGETIMDTIRGLPQQLTTPTIPPMFGAPGVPAFQVEVPGQYPPPRVSPVPPQQTSQPSPYGALSSLIREAALSPEQEKELANTLLRQVPGYRGPTSFVPGSTNLPPGVKSIIRVQ